MNAATHTRIAAALGLLAVALGAFGAHGLKEEKHQKTDQNKGSIFEFIPGDQSQS